MLAGRALVAATLWTAPASAQGALHDLTYDETRLDADRASLEVRHLALLRASETVEAERCLAKLEFLKGYREYRSTIAFVSAQTQALREELEQARADGAAERIQELQQALETLARMTPVPSFAGQFAFLEGNPVAIEGAPDELRELMFVSASRDLEERILFLEQAAINPLSSAAARDEAQRVLGIASDLQAAFVARDASKAQGIVDVLRRWILAAPVSAADVQRAEIRPPATLRPDVVLFQEDPGDRPWADGMLVASEQAEIGPGGDVACVVLVRNERSDSLARADVEIRAGKPGAAPLRRVLGVGDALPGSIPFHKSMQVSHVGVDAKGRVTFGLTGAQGGNAFWREEAGRLSVLGGDRKMLALDVDSSQRGNEFQLVGAGEEHVVYRLTPFFDPADGRGPGARTNPPPQPQAQEPLALCAGPFGQARPIVRVGEHAPGLPDTIEFAGFGAAAAAPNGQYAAFLPVLSGPGAEQIQGIWRWGPQGTELVARAPSELADGSRLESFLSTRLAVSSRGEVLFNGLVRSGDEHRVRALVAVPGSLRFMRAARPELDARIGGQEIVALDDSDRVLLKGEDFFEGPAQALGHYPDIDPLAISPSGLVVTRRVIQQPRGAGAGATADVIDTLWAGRPGDMQLVLRAGDSVEIAPGDVRPVSFQAVARHASLTTRNLDTTRIRINDRGQVLLRLELEAVLGKCYASWGWFVAHVPAGR